MPNKHAAQPHSVRSYSLLTGPSWGSSKAFVVGASGLPEPNVARFEASPFVCFADGGTAGAGGSGAGGEGGAGGQPPEKTFTQAELNALLARERRATEEKLSKQFGEQAAATKAELEDLRAKFEDAGKSAAEKAQAQAARERATIEARLAEAEKARQTAEATAQQHAHALRDERTNYELGTLLDKHKVMPEARRLALLGFRADAKLDFDAEGRVAGVDLASGRYASLGEAVDAWMKEHGALFVAAVAGGAGTRAPNGRGLPADLSTLSDTELIRLSNERRPAR